MKNSPEKQKQQSDADRFANCGPFFLKFDKVIDKLGEKQARELFIRMKGGEEEMGQNTANAAESVDLSKSQFRKLQMAAIVGAQTDDFLRDYDRYKQGQLVPSS